MLELLYLELIVDFIDDGLNLRFIDENTLTKAIHIRYKGNYDINTIDLSIMRIIDHLIQKYSLLGSLVKICRIKNQAISIRDRHYNDGLGFDLFLLIKACDTLYRRIESLFLPDILYKLYLYFTAYKENTFDTTNFFKDVTRQKIDYIYNESTLDQELLFQVENRELRMQPLKDVLDKRNRVMEKMIKLIDRYFTPSEIENYTVRLIDLLSINLTEEYAVIVKAIVKSANLIEEANKKKKMTSEKTMNLFTMTQ